MKSKPLLAVVLGLILALAGNSAAAKSLRWSRLAVTAHLDADGRLHVDERHSIVFDGDWNGGERTFRRNLENVIRLQRISRIGPAGEEIPLRERKSLSNVDDYSWFKSNTLRWRSRLPSDPPFENREITYRIEYTDSNILIPQADGTYLLDHNFGLPDLQYPIDAYSLDLTLDPAWKALDLVPSHVMRAHSSRGENVTITARLRHLGAAAPAAVNFGASAPIRYALLFILLAGAVLLAALFVRRERSIGRFEPLPDPSAINRQWLEENVFKYLPEVVGAAWDDRTGAAEVSAVLARLVHEGKMSSRVEKGGLFRKDNLVLTLNRSRESFSGYEAALVKALFIDGDTTSTDKVREYYRSKGFDPASKIRAPLSRKVEDLGQDAPPIGWKPTLILLLAGLALLVAGCFPEALNIVFGIAGGGGVLLLWAFGMPGAFDYRRRLTNLAVASLEFAPMALLILAIPALLLLRVLPFRLGALTLGGLTLVALAAARSLLNTAKSRDGGDRLETRRRLTAARDYFARELQKPKPALEDAWFPYLLAFGLGTTVDRWFRSFGGTAAAAASSFSGSSSTSGSSSSGGSGWTGGGGAFGGAGASGTWAVAAAGMSAGVAAPSSSGGGGGGGSSGGGGGGGW